MEPVTFFFKCFQGNQQKDNNAESLGGFGSEKEVASASCASALASVASCILVTSGLRASDFPNRLLSVAAAAVEASLGTRLACMYFIRWLLQNEFRNSKSRAFTKEQSEARLYDPEEAFLILPTDTASSAG